jgi:AraC family transcriptional regulator of adaptative response / DNA-3-methyladenine glycosylase II
MDLDWRVCSRARLSRDARFDGKFFIGVLTSRIYCRPICPARTSLEKNVRYFPTAAAAAEAGFRPCLRCRPECSPGTPAWVGTPVTVSRALHLIDESGLEDGGVDCLAERLGVGSRHLRRLFLQHLGATPSAVARTRRLHFAKKLISETSLPMNQIALAAGFGCVRRFNAGILQVYHRTPTQIRRLARQANQQPENRYVFRLGFRPPYDWKAMFAFLAERGTPGVEAVSSSSYARTIALGKSRGFFEVSPDKEENVLIVRVQFDDPRRLFFVIERVRAMFDLNADWEAIAAGLRTDPMLLPCIERRPGVRVPGCWSGFELAARSILDGENDPRAARSLAAEFVRFYGEPCPVGPTLTHLFPHEDALADADFSHIGLSVDRSERLRALARATRDGRIRFERITDSEFLRSNLHQVAGLDPSTAEYIAMRALGDPDGFPTGDLARLGSLRSMDADDLESRAEAWRPWRSYAAMYVWISRARGTDRQRLTG